MIIDLLRNLSDREYEKFQDIYERYCKAHVEAYNAYTDEEAERVFYDLVSIEEVKYLEEFDSKAQKLIDHFEYERRWHRPCQTFIPLKIQTWLNRRNITFVIIRKPVARKECLFIKEQNDYNLFLIKLGPMRYVYDHIRDFVMSLKWTKYNLQHIKYFNNKTCDVEKWCNKNCEGLFVTDGKNIFFEYESDLCAFLLVWKE